ncbi:MAG: hypothetical protein K8R90_05140 [Candidatus Cloacimonetes bacterium]|nr:hypothetical protein [Candidatus Cloacimonadota bacterium]
MGKIKVEAHVKVVGAGKAEATLDGIKRRGEGMADKIEQPIDINVQGQGAMASLRDVTVAAQGVIMAVKGIGSAAASFMTPAIQFEAYRTRLVTLYGDVERAEAAFKSFKETAAKTPFQLDDVVQAGAALKAYGLNAEETLPLVADLAAFMQVDMVTAAGQFGRAMTAGLGSADLFREKGVNAIIASLHGLDDATQASSEQIVAALTDPTAGIIGATEALSQTTMGAMSNMQDSVTQLKATIGDSLLPMLKEATGWMASVTNYATDLINEMRGISGAQDDMAGAAAAAMENMADATEEQIRLSMEQHTTDKIVASTRLQNLQQLNEMGVAGAEGRDEEIEQLQRLIFYHDGYNQGLLRLIGNREADAAATREQATAMAEIQVMMADEMGDPAAELDHQEALLDLKLRNNDALGEQVGALGEVITAQVDLANAEYTAQAAGELSLKVLTRSFASFAKAAKVFGGEGSEALLVMGTAYKAFATTQAIIDTHGAAIAAFKSTAAIPIVGPVLAPVAAAAAIAAGMVQVAAIQSQKFAAGGTVRGPGGPKDDLVPAMLSDGEFVINAEAAETYRPLLQGINFGTLRPRAHTRAVQANIYASQFMSEGGLVQGLHNMPAPRLAYAAGGAVNTGGWSGVQETLIEVRDSVRAMNANLVNKQFTGQPIHIETSDPDLRVRSDHVRAGSMTARGDAYDADI